MKSVKRLVSHLREKSEPRKGFREALWKTLEADLPRTEYSWQRLTLAPTAAVILLALMGVGTYAYASPEVTDEHLLYPIKTRLESVERRLPRHEKARAEFETRMLHRRLDEAEVLHAHDALRERHLERVEDALRRSGRSLEDLPNHAEVKARMRLHMQSRFPEGVPDHPALLVPLDIPEHTEPTDFPVAPDVRPYAPSPLRTERALDTDVRF
ncbi:MAG: hypothetical protein UY95_C0008G0006 [Parcubacteria group bacterium GW2011_GWA2_56_7]|nr:MAG: hypothetical protein UY95_C0008G0006 [Parcubacteria group bacterium GW2011_GWA2_56_7]